MPAVRNASPSRTNELAPIFSIPPEILQMIFLLCREMICDHRCTCHSRQPQGQSQTRTGEERRMNHKGTCNVSHHGTRHRILLTLSYVCRAWYIFIFHTPTLWDVVDLVYPLSVLTATLPLRKDIPITATGSFSLLICCGMEQQAADTRDISSKFDWLLDNCSQIKTLSISLNDMNCLSDVMIKIGEHQAKLRHLKVLDIATGRYQNSGSLSRGQVKATSQPKLHLPAVTTLSLVNVGVPPWLPNTSTLHLRRLRIEMLSLTPNSLRNFLDLLRRCSTTLEDVEFNCYIPDLPQDECQAMAKHLVACHSLNLPHLRNLRIESWTPRLSIIFLNIIQAPQSRCAVTFDSLNDFLEFFHYKPMTQEWGHAIGEYNLECNPDYDFEFSPIKDPHRLSQSSIQHPAVSMGDILMSRESEHWPGYLSDIVDVTRGYVRIKSFTLDMYRFYERADHTYRMRIMFPRGDDYPTSYEPTAAQAFADHSAKERLIKIIDLILAKFPDIQTLSVAPLPRRENNDLTAYQELAQLAHDRYCRNRRQKVPTCSDVKIEEDRRGRIRMILTLHLELPTTTTA